MRGLRHNRNKTTYELVTHEDTRDGVHLRLNPLFSSLSCRTDACATEKSVQALKDVKGGMKWAGSHIFEHIYHLGWLSLFIVCGWTQ